MCSVKHPDICILHEVRGADSIVFCAVFQHSVDITVTLAQLLKIRMFAIYRTIVQERRADAIQKRSKREIDRRRRTKSKVVPIEVMMSMSHRTHRSPNMSKKMSGSKLYPFPSFDKCDSLLFFPSTFSSCVNSADLASLERLLRQRTDKNCAFHACGKKMDLDAYMNMFEMMNEMHPDSVTCVHQTKVIENQIRVVIYFKYTENKFLRKVVEKKLTPDHLLLEACPTPRLDSPSFAAFLATKPDEENFKLNALMCSDDDMVMYGTSTMVLTIEETTRKITRFEGSWECTSFCAVE